MQTTPANRQRLQRRCGFSLVELMIVLAVLTVVAGVILPSMRGPLDKSRLTAAAKQLQASLAKARSLAIRETVDVFFRYEISGDRYVIERRSVLAGSNVTVLEDLSGAAIIPSGLAVETASSPTLPAETSGEYEATATVLRSDRLPEGVTFAELETLTIASTPGATGLSRWSAPIRFRPSGRTDDHKIRLAGQREFVVDVSLRGITSMASYAAPKRVPTPSADAGRPAQPEVRP